MREVIRWLFPTDHRRAAGVFLACSLAMLVVGSVYAARMRLAAHAPNTTQDDDLFQSLHSLILVHFAAVPLLLLVAGLYSIPRLTGRDRVVLPRLLPVATLAHVVACAGMCVATGTRRLGVYRSPEDLLSFPFAMVQVSLVLGSINLLGTVLFRKHRRSEGHRSPVLVTAVGLASVLVCATWVLSSYSWLGAALGLFNSESRYLNWNPWGEFGRTFAHVAGLMASGVFLQILLGEPRADDTRLPRLAHEFAACALWLVGSGYVVGLVHAELQRRWENDDLQAMVEAPGLLVLTTAFALAFVVAARRGRFRQPVELILTVGGLLFVLMGQAAGLLSETNTVQDLVREYTTSPWSNYGFRPVAAHARAAAIAFAVIATLHHRLIMAAAPSARTMLLVGALLLLIGVSVGLASQVAGALEPRSPWMRPRDATEPTEVALTVSAILAGLGIVSVVIGLVRQERARKM